jgi:drug/metabolite transporter (DMT)-like permease
MNPGLWGGLCALGWGTSDFIARFSGRAVGHLGALLGMLLTGSVLLTLWVWYSAPPLVWPADGLWLIGASGIAIMVATLWLYQGLARGPISIVAPIVGSYPALVVAFAVIGGARPNLLQWAAILATMAGVIVVARSVDDHARDGGYDRRELGFTVVIALASAVAFAIGVYLAQLAVPRFGELQTTWLSRLVSLAALLLLLAARRTAPRIPPRWWPAVAGQGVLDTSGYLALYAGSAGVGAEIAAVTASTFGAVTTLLARFLLGERIAALQWLGILLIFAGVAALSGAG